MSQTDSSDASIKEFVEKQLAQLSLEEKVSLCAGNSTMTLNAIPKIGLKTEFVMSDGPHTVRPDLARESFDRAGTPDDHSTNLPTLTALAATWDPTLAGKFGNVLGQECRDRGKDMLLGPGINLMRSPLCGRNFEYMGEDPHLISRIAVNIIKAVQSNDVAACIKHFAVNDQELNRNGVNSIIDDRALREIYLPAFEAAVKEANVLTLMSGYNKFRGEYCSHSDYLNNKILKGEWKFPGLVVTDWGSMHDTKKAALGGTDIEMNAGKAIRHFRKPLLDAVRNGEIPESVVDDKVRRILYVMAQIHKTDGKPRKKGSRNTDEHKATALEVAEAATVLLKNERGILPLKKDELKNLLILGRNADVKHCSLGWSAAGKPLYEITPLKGIRKYLGSDVKVKYSPFPGAEGGFGAVQDSALMTEDTSAKDRGMTIKAWKMSYYGNAELKGKPVHQGFTRKLNFDWAKNGMPFEGKAEDFSVRFEGTIKAPEDGIYTMRVEIDDGARIFVDDKPVMQEWDKGSFRRAKAEVELKKGQSYEFRIEYFQAVQGARFKFLWQLPSQRPAGFDDLLKLVSEADAVILFTGNQHGHGRALECEGGDRPNMLLPEIDVEALPKLLPAHEKTIVVNLSGAPVEMPWIDEAHTLVHYWFSGQEGGNAIARVLFGDVNPSGKLPFTFPKKLKDSPAHYLGVYNKDVADHKEGVFIGYRWFDKKKIEPLFPFGHGLSYTTFKVGDPVLSAKTLKGDDKLSVEVSVTNSGSVDGAEVVQLYVEDPESSVDRPIRELKGFKKVNLKAGETKTVSLELKRKDLSFWDEASNNWKAEPGTFRASVGTSSRQIHGSAEFKLLK